MGSSTGASARLRCRLPALRPRPIATRSSCWAASARCRSRPTEAGGRLTLLPCPLLEGERGRVDAVPQAGRRRTVVDKVPQGRTAVGAIHFGPVHAKAVVALLEIGRASCRERV